MTPKCYGSLADSTGLVEINAIALSDLIENSANLNATEVSRCDSELTRWAKATVLRVVTITAGCGTCLSSVMSLLASVEPGCEIAYSTL